FTGIPHQACFSARAGGPGRRFCGLPGGAVRNLVPVYPHQIAPPAASAIATDHNEECRDDSVPCGCGAFAGMTGETSGNSSVSLGSLRNMGTAREPKSTAASATLKR